MANILVSWIGATDLRAPLESSIVGSGPVAQAAQARQYDEIILLSDYSKRKVEPYLRWLRGLTDTAISVDYRVLSSPTHFGDIYSAVVDAVSKVLRREKVRPELTFHLSPGTPAMAAVWILVSKTRFPAELIESSREKGVLSAAVPFDISADFIPELLREPDAQLESLSAGLAPEAPEFRDIIHRSRAMQRLIAKARLVAPRSVSVLIEGESGTGKELLAHAIHRSSPRRRGPFIPVNCGAIPRDLVESELFGHEKGAFTGATSVRRGYFEAASGGTLFMDEIGDLPLLAQVKLLRVLQEGEVVRLGASSSVAVDVRLIAATNKTLTNEVAHGRFREDLFYRLAVAVLRIPPLRERSGDISLLVERFLEMLNGQNAHEPGYNAKPLTAAARNILLSHTWPGNVRELLNTLQRASIWSTGSSIRADDIEEALLESTKADDKAILGRSLGHGLDLREVLAVVARHYIDRALDESGGNKTKAAELLGLPSYQTLTNWMKRYAVKQ